MDDSWLDLLLAGASAETIDRHRDGLLRGGADATRVDREASAVLRLKSRLDERRRRASELAALNDIAALLAGVRQPSELLPEITTQSRRLLGVDLAYIGLVRGDSVVLEVASGALTPHLRGLRAPRTAGMLGAVITRGEAIWTSDYSTESAFVHDSYDAVAAAERFQALLGVPLVVRDEVIGALFVCKRRERQFTEEEITLLSAMASHAAIAIDNAAALERYQNTAERLAAANEELARTLAWDRQLTGVVLRGGGVDGLVHEIAQAATGDIAFVDARDGVPPDLADRLPELPSLLASLLDQQPEHGFAVVPLDGGAGLARAVVAGRLVVGVMVLVGGEDTDHDRLLLDRAAPVLALAVVGERAVAEATRLSRDALVVDLLLRPEPDPAALRQRMRNAGLEPSTRYCLVAVEPGEDRQRARGEIDALGLPAGTVIAADGPRLVAVVPTGDPEALARTGRTGGRLATVTAGIAGPTTGPADFHHRYRDAVATLDALLTLGRTGTVVTADELGIYRVLLSHTGRDQLRAQLEESLGAVLREQERRSVPLLPTLKAYLDHGGRAAPAAKELGIHVNTLYQRLAVLDRLLGPTWRDAPRSLDLHMLLRVHPEQLGG
ncbi:helix-turn-helix domain-containing protein [Streptomyces gamaensis]|uniref:Helix-turn-helix domain-containing protein n=1 Tax=Streptomyces gamaensis TaxID=1763542 RepID=A0ABW0Z7L5_9ACTN